MTMANVLGWSLLIILVFVPAVFLTREIPMNEEVKNSIAMFIFNGAITGLLFFIFHLIMS